MCNNLSQILTYINGIFTQILGHIIEHYNVSTQNKHLYQIFSIIKYNIWQFGTLLEVNTKALAL